MLNKLTSLALLPTIYNTFKLVQWGKLKKRLQNFTTDALNTLNQSLTFLPDYYRMNEKIWLEGLLVDWLQKSIFDKWVKRFLIHSSYLFNERVMFDLVVRFYIDYVIWFSHSFSIWNVKSISSILSFFILSLLLTVNFVVLCSFTSLIL